MYAASATTDGALPRWYRERVLAAGSRLGRYEIVAFLGRGGMWLIGDGGAPPPGRTPGAVTRGSRDAER
jgi:hypothetical protein